MAVEGCYLNGPEHGGEKNGLAHCIFVYTFIFSRIFPTSSCPKCAKRFHFLSRDYPSLSYSCYVRLVHTKHQVSKRYGRGKTLGCLLLDVMAHCQSAMDTFAGWQAVLTRHGVPESFFAIADFFWHPVFNDRQDQPGLIINASMLDAIEECLWRWKTPLSREWYPYIFGLKHDLAAYNNTLPALRILKTQTRALAERLLNHST